MGLMQFREGNKVKWVGVRPAHRGEQVVKSVDNVTNTTTILYTVTAGKVFCLCSARINGYATTTGVIKLLVRDADDTIQYTIMRWQQVATSSKLEWGSFWPPLEIPADYDVCLLSSSNNCYVHGFIFGWEEDV